MVALTRTAAVSMLAAASLAVLAGSAPPRARDLGIPFEGSPGALNAITDVAGVTVGHATIVRGEGPLGPGEGLARTGVTAILPRGRDTLQRPSFAGWHALNGNGEMTGTTWVKEGGFLEGPIMITNTHSVGVVRDAVIAWRIRSGPPDASGYWWSLPMVAETDDSHLNDMNAQHVKPEHVFAALEGATPGPVAEGSVGGGTGMIAYGFKAGIGTASRVVKVGDRAMTVGVLVQANFGRRSQLVIAGVPVGRELTEPVSSSEPVAETHGESGSVIVVVGTDAPLLPHQLERLARRVSLGLARTGSTAGNGSGDIFVAFSTANADASRQPIAQVQMVANDAISPLFTAVVQATEEAVINALVASATMVGLQGHRVPGLPHDGLRSTLRKYNRLVR